MKSIIVVDCISTGINFIGDIVNRGYKPVVLELKSGFDDVEKYKVMVNSFYDKIDEKFDMIFEKDSYEETLEEVRKSNPEIIVPGSERGVILATKLANDLNLLCNPIENIDAMTLKDEMHNRLAEKGLRYIRGRTVTTVEEACEFYDEESLTEVVVKPVYSAASVGVKICENRDEMIDALNENFSEKNYYGQDMNELIVQERIKGEEYFINTVSNEGIHRVTTIWKYNKVHTADGDMIYDTIETVNEIGIGEAEMVEYAYKVADAIGIQFGAVHGEYMIDSKGPVLIEVNCRPNGCTMPAEFIDRISGQHETDSILDSYLKPSRFHAKRKERYRLNAYAALKLFIVPEDIMVRSSPMSAISPRLKSFYQTTLDYIEEDTFFMKTKDLETSGGLVYMVHEDKAVLQGDIDYLRSVERNVFSLVLSDEKDMNYQLDEEKLAKDLKEVVSITEEYGTGLLITDQFLEGVEVLQVGLDGFADLNGEFDYVIVNLNRSLIDKRDDLGADIILNIFSDIKVGGIVFIPETTYRYISSGRKGVEALLKTLDLRIEVPPYGFNPGVIASRNHY